MKIVVTGSNGQLGSEIKVVAGNYPHVDFLFTDIDELDICDYESIERYFSVIKPDYLVNCAAYTAVDRAEDDEENARKINEHAVENISKLAAKYSVKILHISTDYVFDGTNHKPYVESDVTSPIGVYGRTKLGGETALLKYSPDAIIIRTSWLYSSFGGNFVKTMLRLGNDREKLTIIFDQVGTPTYANDLASVICKIILSKKWIAGVYHYSNEGVCSWYDFAIECHKLANVECEVFPIESRDYPVRTPRPHYSVLNKRKIKETYDVYIPHWKLSLEKCIKLLSE